MDDHREGIQADKPIPPWERPDYFRLDCAPHRGRLLWWLGFVSLSLGLLALVPCCGWLPGLVGIPLGLCSRYMAKRDLARMGAGRMDLAGEGITATALSFSSNGLWFSILGTVFWGGLILLFRWLESR